MIKAEHLTKRFGKHYAVNDLTFTVDDGEIVGFLGPNGAGKSTTMNMLTGYISSSAGSVEIDGHDILTDTIAAKKAIGYLPEKPPLYEEMTVGEYLNFVYDLKGCALNRKKHVEEVLAVTQTADVRGRVIRNLSKGYHQRVGIAQALIGDPKTIILDEPTIGLDPRQIVEMRNLIRVLGRDHAVILSTHILGEVQAVCDRILIINRGRLVADERTDKLVAAAGGTNRLRVCVAAPAKSAASAFRSIPGVTAVSEAPGAEENCASFTVDAEPGVDVRRALFRVCVERDWTIMSLEAVGADLENVYISLTGAKRRRAAKGAAEKEARE